MNAGRSVEKLKVNFHCQNTLLSELKVNKPQETFTKVKKSAQIKVHHPEMGGFRTPRAWRVLRGKGVLRGGAEEGGFEGGASSFEAGDGHAERAAGHVVETNFVEEVNGARISTVFATYAEWEVWFH